jgi:hypothetical protein
MSQHVRMDLEANFSFSACPFDHACESSGGEGRCPLRREHERRLALLLALKPPQGA